MLKYINFLTKPPNICDALRKELFIIINLTIYFGQKGRKFFNWFLKGKQQYKLDNLNMNALKTSVDVAASKHNRP